MRADLRVCACGSWWACACGTLGLGSHSPERCSSRTKSATRQRLAAARRVDAGGEQPAGRLVARTRPLGERVARRLAPLREGDVDQFEHLRAEIGVGRPRRRFVPVDAHQPRVHPRNRPEHRRRHHAVAPDVAVEPELDAGHAVVLAAGFGGEPLGDLGLHHHHHRADRRELGEQVQQRRDGDVVRQVGDQRRRLLGQVWPAAASGCRG